MKTRTVIAVIIALLVPSSALACKCARTTPEERTESADLVFTGRAEKSEFAHSGLWTHFQAVQLFKVDSIAEKMIPESPHNKANTILIIQELTSCDANFENGKTYKIYAHIKETTDGHPFLTTSMCNVE